MRSAVGAVCIFDRALRDDGFFFVFFAVEVVFEEEDGFFAVVAVPECEEVVDCFVVLVVAAELAAEKIHKPLTTKSPPSARRYFVRRLVKPSPFMEFCAL